MENQSHYITAKLTFVFHQRKRKEKHNKEAHVITRLDEEYVLCQKYLPT